AQLELRAGIRGGDGVALLGRPLDGDAVAVPLRGELVGFGAEDRVAAEGLAGHRGAGDLDGRDDERQQPRGTEPLGEVVVEVSVAVGRAGIALTEVRRES